MQLLYNNSANKGGIYRIVNTKNGRVYIGSTKRFKSRWRAHCGGLESGRHTNRFLQNDYNKCGPSVFLIEVLEVIDNKDEMIAREQCWIDQLYDNQKNCYNLRKDAVESRSGKRNTSALDPTTDKRCRKPTAETKAKKKAAIRKYFEEEYDEEAKQIRSANIQKFHEEHGKYLGLVLTHMETGEQVTVQGSVRTFCKERGLSYKAFHQLIKGKIKSSGGWIVGTEKPVYVERKGEKRKPLTKEHREKIAKGKYEGVVLVNDRGETLTLGKNVKEQAREHGLYYTTLLKVIHKETKSVSGWQLSPSPAPICSDVFSD